MHIGIQIESVVQRFDLQAHPILISCCTVLYLLYLLKPRSTFSPLSITAMGQVLKRPTSVCVSLGCWIRSTLSNHSTPAFKKRTSLSHFLPFHPDIGIWTTVQYLNFTIASLTQSCCVFLSHNTLFGSKAWSTGSTPLIPPWPFEIVCFEIFIL